uniref:Reverse transcriptase zinc-binding domain-containing protein n=1 Tax=Cajanus cajan TaxID=3821 RepID=A0A151TV95_CAJCA|nr:hypothetical protein KK1_010219 [Cajanus cajan]
MAYRVLQSENLIGEENSVFKWLWSIKAPPKALIFLWRVINGGIPTVDNLLKRNITLSDQQSLCVLCKSDRESASHLFCSCPVVHKVWKICLGWINCPSPIPQQVGQFLNFVPAPLTRSSQIDAWRSLWLATIRTVWLHRNKVIFQGAPFNQDQVTKDILCTSWQWLDSFTNHFKVPFSLWITNPGLGVMMQ